MCIRDRTETEKQTNGATGTHRQTENQTSDQADILYLFLVVAELGVMRPVEDVRQLGSGSHLTFQRLHPTLHVERVGVVVVDHLARAHGGADSAVHGEGGTRALL